MGTKAQDIFPLLGEVAQAGGAVYGSAYGDKIREKGFNPQDEPDWYVLVVSLDFEPETTSLARFVARTPYANPASFAAAFTRLVERGLLEPAGADEYRISQAGHAIIDEIMNVFYGKLAEMEPLPAADMQRVIGLLGRMVDRALELPEPAVKDFLKYNRSSDLGPDGAPMQRVLQYLADLNSFRDDAHIAAWKPQGVSGPAWEALTLLWRDEAQDVAGILEQRPYRRFTADDYTTFIQELANKGWVAAINGSGKYRVTDSGSAMRQQAEDQTDRYYYAAWDALNEAELAELADLLPRLRDGLKALAPEPQE